MCANSQQQQQQQQQIGAEKKQLAATVEQLRNDSGETFTLPRVNLKQR